MKATAAEVAGLLGVSGDADTLAAAAQAIPLAEAMVSGYCRDVGFTETAAGTQYPRDLHAVVLLTATRLVSNPEQLAHATGGASINTEFRGLTAFEQTLCRRYRVGAVG